MDETHLTGLAVAAHERWPLNRLLVFTERLLAWGGRTRDLLALPGPRAADVLPFRDKAVMKRRAAAVADDAPAALAAARAAVAAVRLETARPQSARAAAAPDHASTLAGLADSIGAAR
jgi:hypothetical protein